MAVCAVKICPYCKGSGQVRTPAWFMVQLFEMGEWHDYQDYPDLQDAIDAALETRWGAKARVRQRKNIVWSGMPLGQ